MIIKKIVNVFFFLESKLEFVLPQEYKDDQIRSISVYDRRAETKVLDAIDGRHCFCVIQLNDYQKTKFRLEAGQNKEKKMGVGYIQYAPDRQVKEQLITKVQLRSYVTFKKLGDMIKIWYQGSAYHPIDNNCYHVAERILQYLGLKKQSQLVKEKRRLISQNGVGNASGIIGAVSLGILGLGCGIKTGNWVPLQKIGLDSNKIMGVFKLVGVGVTKIVNKVAKN